MERLGASTTDGVWLRARVRNGRVGLRDEKVNVKSKYQRSFRQCRQLTTPPEPGVLHRGEYPQFTLAMTGWTLYGHWFLRVTVNEGCECVIENAIVQTLEMYPQVWSAATRDATLRAEGMKEWRRWNIIMGFCRWQHNSETHRFYSCIYIEIQHEHRDALEN